MFEINIAIDRVIPASLRAKIQKYYLIGIVLTGSVLFVYIIMALKLSSKLRDIRLQESQLQNNIQIIIDRYDISTWSREWTDYYTEMKMIDNAYSERLELPRRLFEIYNMLPESMYIEHIEVSKDSTFMLISLVSAANEQEEYGEVKRFITDLDSSIHFGKGSRLVSQERTQINNRIVSMVGIKVPLYSSKD